LWGLLQRTLLARSVLVATGGYASDFTNTSLLRRFRPDLVSLPTTNGAFTTGDGIKFAAAAGADLVDMANVQVAMDPPPPPPLHGFPSDHYVLTTLYAPLCMQVHPTGFVDPKHPDAKVKTLCAELLRGVGGILLDAEGRRFANELGTRDYIVGRCGHALRGCVS
jgi:succinate dehydrogenase/fumarate reductase flavoprotein subunit